MDLSDIGIAFTNVPSIEQVTRMTETKSSIEVTEGGTATRKRRSKRIHIAMPVIVRATSGNLPLEEATKTLRVNAHGCLICLTSRLALGQQVSLVNPATREEVACKVNFVGKEEREATEVGLEFTYPSPLFWRIHFPPEDWNPEDRKLPSVSEALSSLPRRVR